MKYLVVAISLFFIVSCNTDTDPKLPSVEERTAAAIEDLRDELISPSNGWRIDYRPAGETGSFFILMDFNNDGTVRVQSDVVANGGEFRDQTISYRIDSSQGLELILETYGVFHYLFELNRASFGGEFEFLFVEERSGNLLFSSKSDVGFDVTQLLFEPAGVSDSDLISTEALNILEQGIFQRDDLGGIGAFSTFNFHIPANNHTISASFDIDRRRVNILGIAEGTTVDEIIAANNGQSINETILFGLEEERLVLDETVTISFGGASYNLSEIPVQSPTKSLDSFCAGQMDSVVSFSASNVTGLGNFTASSSLFQTHNGVDYENATLGVVHDFIYDENDNSIADQIEAVFPEAAAFQLYFGLELEGVTSNVVGFVTVDSFNNAEFFLRGFDFVQNGNFIELVFNGEDLITATDPSSAQIDGLYQLTDDIFAGGGVYLMSITTLDDLIEFYNPCNKYKGYLF